MTACEGHAPSTWLPRPPLTNSTLVAVAVLGLAARPAATDRVSGWCASLLGFTPASWGLGGVGAVSGEARAAEQAEDGAKGPQPPS